MKKTMLLKNPNNLNAYININYLFQNAIENTKIVGSSVP